MAYKIAVFKMCTLLLAALLASATLSSCNNKSYPCPGLGQNNEADMNMFDEDGKLKDSKNFKSRRNNDNGLVNKKSPKKIKAPRKTHI